MSELKHLWNSGTYLAAYIERKLADTLISVFVLWLLFYICKTGDASSTERITVNFKVRT